MTAAFFIILAIFSAPLAVVYLLLPHIAPEGYQDETGFHLGKERK